jgi:hypothetical protein
VVGWFGVVTVTRTDVDRPVLVWKRCRPCRRTFTKNTVSAFSGYRWPRDVIVMAVRQDHSWTRDGRCPASIVRRSWCTAARSCRGPTGAVLGIGMAVKNMNDIIDATRKGEAYDPSHVRGQGINVNMGDVVHQGGQSGEQVWESVKGQFISA